MQVRFLLGPAGSGKTHRCLAEIRAELLRSPEGPPLIFLAPKQATFLLERQLLADPVLPGYTRLHILSFERLAEFVFLQAKRRHRELLNEEGRVMVLRALLQKRREELKIFRASARMVGFASQLSQILRELQSHQLSVERLRELAARSDLAAALRDKLHDLALLLKSYHEWLEEHRLADAGRLLDFAASALQSEIQNPKSKIQISGLWLDGFAQMTPQELSLLAAVASCCHQVTLAFCLEKIPAAAESWLSPWNGVVRTYLRCHEAMSSLPDCHVAIDTLARSAQVGRFAGNPILQHLEESWSQPKPFFGPAQANPSSAVRLVRCANPEAEAAIAAREILRHVREGGGRFRDCAVLLRRLEGYHDVLRRVFSRYDIPFFLDRREPTAHHSLGELTRYALRLVALGWEHDDWFGALKTGLVHVDDDAIDRLENEALARGWRGDIWVRPLRIPNAESLEERLERLRRQIVPPFQRFLETLAEFDRKPTGPQLSAALHRLWEDLQVERQLDQWTTRITNHGSRITNPIHTAVWEQMHAWLENLELAFASESLSLTDWLPVVEAGLANLSVGVVPPALDQVLIGAIDRSRNPDLQLALVLGLNEGIFPAPPAPARLLTDTDRRELAERGAAVGLAPRDQLGLERYYAYIVCTRARQRLVLTCAARGVDDKPLNPSPFIEHVRRMFPDLPLEEISGEFDVRSAEHPSELIVPVLRSRVLLHSPSALPGGEKAAFRLDEAPLASLPALAPVLAKWEQIVGESGGAPLSPALAERIYGREMATSVSGLEDFAACPFKFFVGRGLRAEERQTWEVDRRERGSFQHEILKEFHRRLLAQGQRWRDVSTAEARALVRRIGNELTPAFRGGLFLTSASGRFTARALVDALEQLMEALIGWAEQYQFDPHAVEVSFGLGESPLPAWRIDLGVGHALLLRGRIDRVDLCRAADSDAALAVVVDYKSRGRPFDPLKLQHGLELQLLAYLGVLSHLADPQGEFKAARLVPAGVFYVPLRGAPKGGANREEAQDDPQRLRAESYQHRGRFDGDQWEKFDQRAGSKGEQFRFAKNKDGALSKRGNEALPGPEFRALVEQAEEFLRQHGQAIYAGAVRVAPYQLRSGERACDFCEYQRICRFDPWTEPYRVLRAQPKSTEAAAGPRRV